MRSTEAEPTDDNPPPGEYPDFDAEDEAIIDRVWEEIDDESSTSGDRPGSGPGTVY